MGIWLVLFFLFWYHPASSDKHTFLHFLSSHAATLHNSSSSSWVAFFDNYYVMTKNPELIFGSCGCCSVCSYLTCSFSVISVSSIFLAFLFWHPLPPCWILGTFSNILLCRLCPWASPFPLCLQNSPGLVAGGKHCLLHACSFSSCVASYWILAVSFVPMFIGVSLAAKLG